MELDDALALALSGDAVLFTGAGFSVGATNLRGAEFRQASDFADYLSGLCGQPVGLGLEDAAEEFVQKFDEDRLISELQHEFSAQDVSPAHLTIASIPWRRVYTTNYDNVLEVAGQKMGAKIRPVTLDDGVRSIPKDQRLSVHVHGFIDRLTRDNLWTDVKLTDSSFLFSSFADSKWSVLFRQDLSQAKAAFFLGWSARDLDFRRILAQTGSLRDKSFFVLGPQSDLQTMRRARKLGEALALTTTDFARLLREKQKVYEPVKRTAPTLHSWRHAESIGTSRRLQDVQVFDLFMFGRLDRSHAYNALHGGPQYITQRSSVTRVLHALNTGDRLVVIHGRLGNRKTMLLEALRHRAVEDGFVVYDLNTVSETSETELGQIWSTSQDKLLFVIDNYPAAMSIVRHFAMNAPLRASLVMAARTSAHDVLSDDVTDIWEGPFKEFNTDFLTDAEVEWCIGALDEYGLWGEMTAIPHDRKKRFIEHECGRQFHALLLKVFEAPQVIERLNTVVAGFGADRETREIFTAILLLSVMNIRVTLDNLGDLYGSDAVSRSGFRKAEGVKELIDFESGQVQIRSAVAAEFILRKVADPDSCAAILVRLARGADRARQSGSPYYHDLMTELMRYANVRHALPDKGANETTFSYYESIRNLESTRSNPLFWLQYGLAALVMEDFIRTEKYLNNAYALASKVRFRTYQIDNLKARFLLLRAAKSNAEKPPMVDFHVARRIVEAHSPEGKFHYPFRVAHLYLDFYERWKGLLTEVDVKAVQKAAETIFDMVARLSNERRRHPDVRSCEKSIDSLLSQIKASLA